jgi:hypothetical protein
MVARAEALRGRKARRRPPLETADTDVAVTRPVRVPDVRVAAPGVLGSTVARRSAGDDFASRGAGP